MFKKTSISETIFRYNPFSYMSIKLKLIVTYSFIILIVILVLQQTSYYYASNALKNQSFQYSSLIAEKMSNELDMHIDEIDRLTQTTLADSTLINYLTQRDAVRDPGSLRNKYLYAFMDKILNFRRDIDRIYILDNAGEWSYQGVDIYVPPGYDIRKEKWYVEFTQSEDLLMVLAPHYNVFNHRYEVFSVVRKIKTYDSHNILGLIKIDRRINIFDEVCKRGEFEGNKIVILDQNKIPIYNTGFQLTQDELMGVFNTEQGRSGDARLTRNNETMIVHYHTSDYTGWTVVLSIPEKVLLKDINLINRISFLLAVVCGIFALLFSIVISFAITLSVKKLLRGMRNLEKGDLDVRVSLRSRDEITVLANGFNNMVEQIKILMKQNADMQVKKKEAEMKVLQGQINPHFLYNTLDGIRMKAVINRDEEAAYMLEELSKLLRVSANVGREFVRFGDEIGYVSRYINLQNFRYHHKFELALDIDEELMDMVVPKFIIQPLVENSIQHGLEMKKDNRKISISAKVIEKISIIRIEDNGMGMTEERLAAVNRSIQDGDEYTGVQIGLRNISSRLKLYYGESFGIRVDSVVKQGTTVTMLLPAPSAAETAIGEEGSNAEGHSY